MKRINFFKNLAGTGQNESGIVADCATGGDDPLFKKNARKSVDVRQKSEFGHRVASNGNGIGHGAGAQVIFFGAGVNGGITGTSPVLPTNPTSSTHVPMQDEFKQRYSTVMQNRFSMSAAESQMVLNAIFSKVPVFIPQVVLPLEGIKLAASWEEGFTSLQFTVFENDRYDAFLVERSVNGTDFQMVVNFTNTTNNSWQHYFYRDSRINANVVFYRIKGIGKQGVPTYSNIAKLKNGQLRKHVVYPNPITNHTINIKFFSRVYETVSIAIYDTQGKILYNNQVRLKDSQLLTLRVPDCFDIKKLYILSITYGVIVVNEKIMFE